MIDARKLHCRGCPQGRHSRYHSGNRQRRQNGLLATYTNLDRSRCTRLHRRPDELNHRVVWRDPAMSMLMLVSAFLARLKMLTLPCERMILMQIAV